MNLNTISAVSVGNGDTLVVTVRSDELTIKQIKALKKQFQSIFPKNRVAILGVGKYDRIELNVVTTPTKLNNKTAAKNGYTGAKNV